MNIIEYAKCADVGFSERPFGEVDSLLLCQVSYLTLDAKGVALSELYDRYHDQMEQIAHTHVDQNARLLSALRDSLRFGEVQVVEQRTVFDAATSCQYSATLFSVGDALFFACRGTDGTLVGWKEDLDLMYVEDLAAQSHALSWLNELEGRPLIVGGHSKGGNLAVYAAAFCNPSVQKNIRAVYNHDGPGFMPSVLSRDGYRQILRRVHKTVPEMCVFGHILVDEAPYTVIKADTNNIYQHLTFNWQCTKDGTFVLGKGITVRSQIIREICNTIVPSMTMEERETFVTTVYESLRYADVNRVGDIASLKTVAKALSYNRHIGKESRARLSHCIHLFLSVAWGSSREVTEEYIGATLNEWRAKRQEKKLTRAKDVMSTWSSPAPTSPEPSYIAADDASREEEK